MVLGPLKRYLRHEPKAFMHGGCIHTLPFHTILTVHKWIAGERRDASPSAKMEASLVRAARYGCFFFSELRSGTGLWISHFGRHPTLLSML